MQTRFEINAIRLVPGFDRKYLPTEVPTVIGIVLFITCTANLNHYSLLVLLTLIITHYVYCQPQSLLITCIANLNRLWVLDRQS